MKRHGRGRHVWRAAPFDLCENYYDGDWLDDEMKGHGTRLYENGNKYEGLFRANERHGKGKLVWPARPEHQHEVFYDGDWESDCMTGYATYQYASGTRYVGQFKDGLGHGFGKMVWKARPED